MLDNDGRLSSASVTARIIKENSFHFKKKYGQNFLIDFNIIQNIVKGSQVSENDVVIEIGPGIGTLTQEIAEYAHKVIIVEIDGDLIPILKANFIAYNNIEVIHNDIMKVDISKIVARFPDKNIKVIANLPYYITTPIVMKLLEDKTRLSSITVMVQREVADRMQAQSSTKDYGALTLAVNYYTTPQVLFKVSPDCFMPKPNVESAVIRMKLRDKLLLRETDEKVMFALVREAFNQRRKTLINAIGNGSLSGIGKEEMREVLEHFGISDKIRGEALALEDFCNIASYIVDQRGIK